MFRMIRNLRYKRSVERAKNNQRIRMLRKDSNIQDIEYSQQRVHYHKKKEIELKTKDDKHPILLFREKVISKLKYAEKDKTDSQKNHIKGHPKTVRSKKIVKTLKQH